MSKAIENQNIDLIEISKANVDFGSGESQSAISRKIELSETERKIKELQQYEYKRKSKGAKVVNE